MAARPLQPSEYEIQREVEALKDLRRRSTNPSALTIDPDLPNQSPPGSPTSQYWSKSPNHSSTSGDNSSRSGPVLTSSSPDQDSTASGSRQDAPNNPADDPFHLFWVPAGLHPEIAPAEFRAFLKEHARAPPDDSPSRSSSPSLSSSSSLSRKRSMLSRQYRPKENDGVEEENIVPLKRNRSLLYPTNPGPQLTISDLQKLEELAEEATTSDDPTRLRSVLRRSLSMNLSPTALDLMDEVPDMGDEADVPIIVPPPGQILRRAARTKIRKPGLPGDGGGHRFAASRRGAGAKASQQQPPAEARTSSEMSSSDHGDEMTGAALRRPTFSDENVQPRPESYSEETSIYDSYAREDDEEDVSYTPVLLTPQTQESLPLPMEEPRHIPIPEAIPVQPEPTSSPILHQPQPHRLVVPHPSPDQPSRTPSPIESLPERPPQAQTPFYTHPPPSISTPSPPPQGRREKDKKGLFGKWGGDKGGKKGGKDKDRENRERASEKEKDSGFFGSLFGKKKQESEYQSSMAGGTSGREAAQALLGASKSSKNYVPPASPGLAPGIGGNPYARYPIHVERAIYRLSHIKLANPRRPLYEQVLISNLMFWYLGVINKAQNPTPTPASNGAPAAGGGTSDNREEAEREEREREQKEKEQQENTERERLERERLEKEQRDREMEQKRKDSGRRGSLTKTPVGGQPGGGRRAEMPIKGPQYEMQHRVMEQEYGGFAGQPPRSPTTGPPINGGPPRQYQRPPQTNPYNEPPKVIQSQPKPQSEQYYYQPQVVDAPQPRPGLPPGAMPPIDQSAWGSQPASPVPPQHRHPSPGPRRSRSPPSHQNLPPHKQPPMPQSHKLNTSQESLGERDPGQRGPHRSLSATAAASPPLPNGNIRKGNSAHAVTSYDRRPRTSEGRQPMSPNGNGEEEDVPLAVYQQQRRK